MNDLTDIDNLTRQIDALMREQQQVLNLVSHDLRSPLNRVFALTQLLEMNSNNLTNEQKNYLEKIHLVIADGLAMMRNLIDYRNLEYRTIELHPETFDAGDLVEGCVKNFRPVADKKNIELHVAVGNNLIATTDKQCLTRVIDNLLANAIKFSPPGKVVRVHAGTPYTDHLKIEVEDQAGGFLKDELPGLFQKFQKFSVRPTAGESSTGLGLYVAKSMAEKIGGTVTCVTTERIGSTFSVAVPKKINQSNK